MAVLLNCFSLRVLIGARVLLDGFSITLSDGDRIGLIGPNGSGKSTLLDILAGHRLPDSGTRALRKETSLAYVPQDSSFPPEATVGSVLQVAVAALNVDPQEKIARLQAMLGRAGFTDPDTPASALSGGWKKRLAIAASLVASPAILLLDEPTNHLDLDGVLWLERAIASVNACLVVTHDRYFLENLATRMIELGPAYPQSALHVNGNYSELLLKREEFFVAQASERASLASKVRREVRWLRRGAKARTSKSRARLDQAQDLIDRLDAASTRTPSPTAQIDFSASERKTRRLIEVSGIAMTLGGKSLFRDLTFILSPGSRFGLVGPNGSGKTTLLKLLEGVFEPGQGSIRRAGALRIVSFAQDRAAHLDPTGTLRRALCPAGDAVLYRGREVHVSGWAKRFLFSNEQLEMPVSCLSGGERARVLIARLMLAPADVLLLDEPTSDLDIPTLEILEESLLDFPGALVLVTHDRYLLDRVSTAVIGLDPSGDAGIYASRAQWEASRAAPPPAARPAPKESPSRPSSPAPQRKLSYLDQREWDSIEQRIAEAELSLAACQRELQASSSDPQRISQACAALDLAQARVDSLYARWTALDEKSSP
jgi:ATP-binding cassette subfamily F protein uup